MQILHVKQDIFIRLPVNTDNSKLSVRNVHENVPDKSLYLTPMSVSSY